MSARPAPAPTVRRFEWRFERTGAAARGPEILRIEVETLEETIVAWRAWTLTDVESSGTPGSPEAPGRVDTPGILEATGSPEAPATPDTMMARGAMAIALPEHAGAPIASLDRASDALHLIIPGVIVAAIDAGAGRLLYARSALLSALGAHGGARETPTLRTIVREGAPGVVQFPGLAVSAGAGC